MDTRRLTLNGKLEKGIQEKKDKPQRQGEEQTGKRCTLLTETKTRY